MEYILIYSSVVTELVVIIDELKAIVKVWSFQGPTFA